MRHGAVAVVALTVTIAIAAAASKWRHCRGGKAHPLGAVSGVAIRPEPSRAHGLGAGPPSEIQGYQDATVLHGDARHTHRAAGRAPRSAPTISWSHNVGGPIEAQVTASSNGLTLYVASLGGKLTALDRMNGTEQWSVALGERAYATPAIAPDGTIYAGSDAKKLIAVSPDGKVKWSLETDGDADTGPALAADGTVVFAAGRVVYAVAPSGHIKWRFAARRKVYTSPAIGLAGRVFFGSQDHHAYGLTNQGALAWSVDLGADVDGAPAVGDDGAVFVGTDGDEIVRLDAESGAIVWRKNVGGYVRGTLSVARDGSVLAGVYGPTPREVRIRADDGGVVGEFAIQGTGAREFGVHGGALEDDTGALLFGTQDDDVYAIGNRGDLLWRFSTAGDVDAPVTLLSDGAVVVGSDDGNVYLLRGARPD